MRSANLLVAWLLLTASACTAILDPARHGGSGADASADAGSAAAPDDAAPSVSDASMDDAVSPASPDAGADAGPPCDEDGDGDLSIACGGEDCDDTSAEIFPFAPPICGNGRAESCELERQTELLALLGV